MITNKDRSDWFGASDTVYIMGKWTSSTFADWWMKKIGINTSSFSNKYTNAGTYIEHNILEFVEADTFDRQILIPELSLRVNLDGEKGDEILECKTYILIRGYKPTKAHIQQVRVQMWATGKKGKIVAYGLTDEDYNNYFLPIDKDRLSFFEIEQDEKFIAEYLKRLAYLSNCLKTGRYPRENEI